MRLLLLTQYSCCFSSFFQADPQDEREREKVGCRAGTWSASAAEEEQEILKGNINATSVSRCAQKHMHVCTLTSIYQCNHGQSLRLMASPMFSLEESWRFSAYHQMVTLKQAGKPPPPLGSAEQPCLAYTGCGGKVKLHWCPVEPG